MKRLKRAHNRSKRHGILLLDFFLLLHTMVHICSRTKVHFVPFFFYPFRMAKILFLLLSAVYAVAQPGTTSHLSVHKYSEPQADGESAHRASLLLQEQDLFLRGCSGDRRCAAAKHAKLQAFREEHSEVYSNLTSGGIDSMIRSGAVLLKGSTCSGHSVLLVRNRLFDWDRSILELLQVYLVP